MEGGGALKKDIISEIVNRVLKDQSMLLLPRGAAGEGGEGGTLRYSHT